MPPVDVGEYYFVIKIHWTDNPQDTAENIFFKITVMQYTQ